jgi:hypothetical protein
VLLGLEAMTMDALLFQGADDTFDHAVLLWTVRCDELLAESHRVICQWISEAIRSDAVRRE